MEELAGKLDTIAGLRVYAYPPRSISVGPSGAAVVSYPTSIEFDKTHGRGMDLISLPVVFAIGQVSDRTTVDRLSEYTDGSGLKSIKAVLEAAPYTSFDDIFVSEAETDTIEIAGTNYLAVVFTLEIAGQGS
jgi:hypothetical protein